MENLFCNLQAMTLLPKGPLSQVKGPSKRHSWRRHQRDSSPSHKHHHMLEVVDSSSSDEGVSHQSSSEGTSGSNMGRGQAISIASIASRAFRGNPSRPFCVSSRSAARGNVRSTTEFCCTTRCSGMANVKSSCTARCNRRTAVQEFTTAGDSKGPGGG